MTFFVFSILQKTSTGYSFFNIGTSSKICTNNVRLNKWNFYPTSHPTNRLGVYSVRLISFLVLNLLTSFSWPFLALDSLESALRWLSSLASAFLSSALRWLCSLTSAPCWLSSTSKLKFYVTSSIVNPVT